MYEGNIAKRYRIIKKLGRGGFGAIYEAFDEERSRKIALKMVPTEDITPESTERFQREAKITQHLNHPAIIAAYEQGEDENGLWLSMELIDGETLDELLKRRGSITEEELLTLLAPLCEALSKAHEQGIVHRDLTPRNIMLGKDLYPKILDFGLAALKGESPLTQSEQISGTPKYMAPEQWEGLKNTDARSDIYSLAVIAYRALSGRFPFDADSPVAWLKKHSNEAPIDLKEAMDGRPLSSPMHHGIMRALSKDPAQRPQSPMAFFQSLKTPALTKERAWWPLAALGFLVVVMSLVALSFIYWVATSEAPHMIVERRDPTSDLSNKPLSLPTPEPKQIPVPLINKISDQIATKGEHPPKIPIQINPNEAAQLATVEAVSSNPAVVPNPTVSGDGSDRTLTFRPIAKGNVTITVTAKNSSGTAQSIFKIIVRDVPPPRDILNTIFK